MTVRRRMRRPLSARSTNAGRRLLKSTFGPIARAAVRLRSRQLLFIDVIGIVCAGFVALALVNEWSIPGSQLQVLVPIIALLLAVRLAINFRFGLYRLTWRHASVPDMQRIVVASVAGTVISMAIFYGARTLLQIIWNPGYPSGFWVAELLLTLSVMGGVRFGIRAASDVPFDHGDDAGAGRRPTLLYGAGQVGVRMARTAGRTPGSTVRPVGFLDDDRRLAGGIVAGLRVYGGIETLEHAVRATNARALLVTMPSAPGSAVRRIVGEALALGLEVKTVPSVVELLSGDLDANRIRRVRVEDLLRRAIVTEHAAGVEDIIRDQVVVITGAGGSIGSELARQVFAIGPRRLILVDRAESPLYMLQRELEVRHRNGKGDGERRIHLANVVSRPAMERLLETERPSVIFHAAAYKHVPMMEEQPSDAVQVNIGGTLVLLEAAEAAGVERFVFVSTDKAVKPTSAMGASKRIAEMLVADAARRTGRPYVSVRFGNVLNSTGSVVPIFQEQLEAGEPLTITHPEMTRYFMTIPEAAWLILDAAALGGSGDLFVLDMGEPVRIMDLATDLVRLSGRDPESQPIDIVGLRPGEKLHEELFNGGERVESTASAKVLRIGIEPPPSDVWADVQRLLSLADGEREDWLRALILDYANDADGSTAGVEILSQRAPASAAPDLSVSLGSSSRRQ
jgi:FlaA1/EpsC-like NDP-sugar epimerase